MDNYSSIPLRLCKLCRRFWALYQNNIFLFVIHRRKVEEGEKEGGKADRQTGLIAKGKVLLSLARNITKFPA